MIQMLIYILLQDNKNHNLWDWIEITYTITGKDL